MSEEPIKMDNIWRNEDGTFKKGHPQTSEGRPKGKTLKEYAREYLMNLPDEQKTEYLSSLPAEIVWKMAEGNPHNTEDITTGGEKIIPIYGGLSVQGHDSDKKGISTPQENKSS